MHPADESDRSFEFLVIKLKFNFPATALKILELVFYAENQGQYRMSNCITCIVIEFQTHGLKMVGLIV